jgi:hypothetical protein
LRNTPQAIWGTFAHVDNAPFINQFGKGPYNFYNPACTGSTITACAPNNERTNPTQVVQMNPDGADNVDKSMKTLILQNNPASVWQYYKLINVQWPLGPMLLSSLKVPVMRPLPDGNPQIKTLMNPVLETFMQSKGTNCLGCHTIARISHRQSTGTSDIKTPAPLNAASYSFMFSYAELPPKP